MPSKSKILGSSWDFSSLWNESLHTIPERVLVPRNYIYASELMGSYIERYLKMNGVVPSNPPNDRSLRKFSAGHVFEWIVGLVLTLTGVLKSRQLRGEYQLNGMLPVAGRLDFIAGGTVDWDAARKEVENIQKLFSVSMSDMPPIVFHAIEKVLASFEAQFKNNPLKEVVFECKSVSSFMSEKLERTNEPMPHHVMQVQHYLLCNGLDEGMLFYVSKDDLLSYQFPVFNDKKTLELYAADVAQMTEYYNQGFNKKNPLKLAPPKDKEVLFDDMTFNFRSNYKVEYSNYLSFVYGYESPMSYRERWDKSVASWNRVFKRCVKRDKMTAANMEVIDDGKKIFPEWDTLVDIARKAGAFKKDDTDGE